jgi:hypothetical protein
VSSSTVFSLVPPKVPSSTLSSSGSGLIGPQATTTWTKYLRSSPFRTLKTSNAAKCPSKLDCRPSRRQERTGSVFRFCSPGAASVLAYPG